MSVNFEASSGLRFLFCFYFVLGCLVLGFFGGFCLSLIFLAEVTKE